MKDLYVVCKVADTEYALPAQDVMQMESYSPITPVPGAPAYVAGLIQIRQQVVPVIDLRIRFGLPATPPGENARFVILRYGTRLVGLLVDAAREVCTLASADFQAPPALASTRGDGFVAAIAQIKDRMIMLLDGRKVISQEIVP